MDGLLLNTVVISGARFYESTVYFPIFYNYLLIVISFIVQVGPFYVSHLHPVKSINTPTVPHWAPPLRAPRRVRHPAACPPYLEYFAPIADLLPLIVLSVHREPRFLPLFAAPCHPFLQHAAWWVQIASLFLRSAGCFRWRPCVWWMNSRSSTGQSWRVQSVRARAVRKLEHRKKKRNEFTTSGSMKRFFLRIRQRSSFHLWVLISHHRTPLNGTKLFYHSWLPSIQKASMNINVYTKYINILRNMLHLYSAPALPSHKAVLMWISMSLWMFVFCFLWSTFSFYRNAFSPSFPYPDLTPPWYTLPSPPADINQLCESHHGNLLTFIQWPPLTSVWRCDREHRTGFVQELTDRKWIKV